MQLLVTLNSFLKSRQKLMIKRRKIRNKNRPISNKKLKEQRKVINYAYEMKLVDIRKQLDRTKSQNHHLNQIIEQLFYPDVALTSAADVDLRAKQISKHEPTSLQQWERLMQLDELTQQISESVLPLQLLSIHEKNAKYFNHSHYQLILQRMGYYCSHREMIIKRKTEAWQKTAAKLKQKQKKTKLKCPYLFLQREQIPLHEDWTKFVNELTKRLQQTAPISQFNKYVPAVLSIRRVFYHIPAELYQLILTRNAAADFSELTPDNISELMKLLKLRRTVKFSPDIKITTPQEISQSEYNITNFARKLVNHIFDNPSLYQASDFINIFRVINSRRKRFSIITQEQLKKSEAIISPILSELTFEDVETFLCIYATLNYSPSVEFVEILKFDLYRKADKTSSPLGLLSVVHRIRGRKLTYQTQQGKRVDTKALTVQGFELLIKLGSALSKMLDQVKSYELTALLDAYFDSQIPIDHISLVQILSAQIVKRGQQFTLEELAKAFFKITLLGHRSKILAKYILQQFLQKYHQDYKKYKQEGSFLLPTDSPIVSQLPQINIKQLHLQECLLMVLWGTLKQLGQNLSKQVNLEQLLTLIPVKIDSNQPLALELALNISFLLQKYGMFPKIQLTPYDANSIPTGRLQQFYRRNFAKAQVQLLLQEEAAFTQLFVGNYNRKDNRFLPERWSMVNAYSLKQYIEYCSNQKLQTNDTSYISPTTKLPQQFVKKRLEILQKYRKDSKTTNMPLQSKSTTKMYQLLV